MSRRSLKTTISGSSPRSSWCHSPHQQSTRITASRTTKDKPLLGKTALVIGGSRGIGREVALALAKQGADTCVTFFRDESAGQRTVKYIRREGVRGQLFQLSAGDAEGTEGVFTSFQNQFGKLDILVYCAARTIFKPLIALTFKQVAKIIELNANGFFLCVQQGMSLMNKGSSIVAVSSLGSQRVFKDYGGLGVAKACIEAMARYLAVELASRGIRVNVVIPGPVDTESIKAVPGYRMKRTEFAKITPFGRIAKTSEVSGAITFLCGKDAGWITGQSLIVDGGLSLRVGAAV